MAANYKRLDAAVNTFNPKHRPAVRALFFHMIANGGQMHSGDFEAVTRMTRAQKRVVIDKLTALTLLEMDSKTATKIATLRLTATAGYKGKQPAKQPINSHESHAVMELWEKYRGPTDHASLRSTYRGTLEDMHRIDGLDWQMIGEIVKYAASEWEKYLQAPSGLRTRSKKYPEKWTWEVCRDQMKTGRNGRPAKFVSKRPKLTREK